MFVARLPWRLPIVVELIMTWIFVLMGILGVKNVGGLTIPLWIRQAPRDRMVPLLIIKTRILVVPVVAANKRAT